LSRTVAIVQARMGSTRLPGKVVKRILGRPVLWHIVDRLRTVPAIDEVVVATSDRPADDDIRALTADMGVQCFRGSEDDVLDRFYQAALVWDGDPVVRITGDCPLVDPELVGAVIALHQETRPHADLTSVATGAGVAAAGFAEGRFPDGLDAEVITLSALHRAWLEATKASDREHVTAYIWRQPKLFRVQHLSSREEDFSKLRWTLDHPEDFAVISRIYEALYNESKPFGMRDVLAFLQAHPEVAAINAQRTGHEGYTAFWQEAADA
jgi:spore coat polysaccharide biosynthesis protein SpsF